MKNKNNKSGYNVPKGYFENFEDTLFSKLDSKPSIPNETGFNVPVNYFKTVENTILEKVNQKQDRNIKKLFLTKTILYGTAIAASLVLVFSIINNTNTYSIHEIASTEIETYLLENNELLSENELLSQLNNEDINTLIKENQTLSNQAIEDYLLEHIDDTTLLTE